MSPGRSAAEIWAPRCGPWRNSSDARTRNEHSARQQWTVNGARLVVATLWVVLAFLSTRPETAVAYNSQTGLILLAAGFVVSLLAYQSMQPWDPFPNSIKITRDKPD